MLATGTVNPDNRSFDITGVNETNTSILTINNTLRLSYTSENGELVQLVKQINPTDDISIGDKVTISPVLEGGLGGYAQKTTGDGVAKSLVPVNWNNIVLTTKTFTDGNGLIRSAVLLPVTMT
jgi:hypothetical protein